ncbi:MAG: hypothetical protein EU539_10515 [Promethearchaeota archaeon]|nr:MAG: hypothetical protein EU539_10515 [Candidatus Lokiarchaeota archaeon]
MSKNSRKMIDYKTISQSLLDSKSKINAVVLMEITLERDDKGNVINIIPSIVYSTKNWDLSNDLEELSSAWLEMKERRITIAGVEYVILQITPERFIATNLNDKGSVVGFKDDERMIFCRIQAEGKITDGLVDAARTVLDLSSKEPYLKPETSLGRVEELKWATPRILLDDTNNLQELGLLRFGLSIEEAQVYLAFLRKGKEGDSVGSINEELDIKRTTIYRILERLIDKGWVVKLPEPDQRAQSFIARPLTSILDERIAQREEELKILKSFRFVMGDSLENGWIDLAEIDKDSKSLLEKGLNFKTLGITGEEKDCGLLIFEYSSSIGHDVFNKAALQLACERLKLSTQIDEDIEEFTNPDLEDLKFENTKIREYSGAIMYIKFREGSKTAKMIGTEWIIAAKLVAIPMENKIHVIWGSEEKFPILMNIILKLE